VETVFSLCERGGVEADTRGDIWQRPLSATVAPSEAVAGLLSNNRLWGRRISARPAFT
jgi:hypothetical protein